MQKVRGRVVTLTLDTLFLVDLRSKSSCHIFREFRYQMNRQVILTFRIDHVDLLVVGDQPTRITDLSTHFRIERGLIQNDLV
jgi:hypothetical protein